MKKACSVLLISIFFAQCSLKIYRNNAPKSCYMTLTGFADNLESELRSKSDPQYEILKYAFVLRYNNIKLTRQWGKKNEGNDDFTADTRCNMASVTKTITAAALLKLINQKGISIDDKIWPYIPKNWNIPASIKEISFRQILMHNSGIIKDPGDETYDSVKKTIENGVDLGDIGKHSYQNINYGVCRILLDYLAGYNPVFATSQGTATSDFFITYLQRNIFSPLNISAVEFKPSGFNDAKFYRIPKAASDFGDDGGDWSLKPGSGGAQISINEAAEFLHALETTETVLPATMRAKMNDPNSLMGWDDYGNFDGDRVHYKGGYLPGPMLSTALYYFDNGVELAIVYNGKEGIDRVYNAYHRSWQGCNSK